VIAIIDYGAGNIRNVLRALTYLGYEATITADARAIAEAQAVVLPGVGAAGDTVRGLRARGLDEVVHRVIKADRPFLGVCVGLQVLFETTEEGGLQPCLGVLPGAVRRLPAGLKVPHMGWNQVHQRAESPVFWGIPDGANFYFVHSYFPDPTQRELVAAETSYGIDFCCAVARGNLFATQFHPEKSGLLGLKIYHNFLKATLGSYSRH
jgi:glutamine amidotransferase